jgi:hypothetical protein
VLLNNASFFFCDAGVGHVASFLIDEDGVSFDRHRCVRLICKERYVAQCQTLRTNTSSKVTQTVLVPTIMKRHREVLLCTMCSALSTVPPSLALVPVPSPHRIVHTSMNGSREPINATVFTKADAVQR